MSNRRNIGLEELLESLKDTIKLPCKNKSKGCKYDLTGQERNAHENECRYREFKCEGASYAGWACDWTGDYKDLENHFKDRHKSKTLMQYRTEFNIPIDFKSDYKDLHLISFFNGQSYFYYKHQVDASKKRIYWTFQYIGFQNMAKHYFYEFEVSNGPVRKFKVTELCHNDTVDVKDIFGIENCVVMSFKAAKNFLNEEKELCCKFRLSKIKNTPS